MSTEHKNPYYKVLVWLTVLTIAEITWAILFREANRGLLLVGLGGMAAAKAALVALYYMHLKYEGKLIWAVMLFPVLLVVVMVSGLLPDAVAPYGARHSAIDR